MRRLAPIAVVLLLGVAAAAQGSVLLTAEHRYNKCVKVFKHQNHARVCGKNILKRGWKERGKKAVEPSRKQVARWSRALNKMRQYPYLHTWGRRRSRTPSGNGVAVPVRAPVGLAACITYRESRNRPRAVNGSHLGIAQWDANAWKADGGHRYAWSPLGATKQEQLIVLSNGLTWYGCRQWCPFDPC